MCRSCWEEAGSPTDLPESVAGFVELVTDLYEVAAAGGPLHVVLDDWNLDGTITPHPGLGPFEDPYDQRDITEYVYDLCEQISTLMNAMTSPERYAAMAVADGYYIPSDIRDQETTP